MKSQILAATAIVAVLSLGACKKATDLPPGTYENSTKATDAAGTEYEKSTTTDVRENPDGSKSATIHQETTRDPEGLLNKETTGEATIHESTK